MVEYKVPAIEGLQILEQKLDLELIIISVLILKQ